MQTTPTGNPVPESIAAYIRVVEGEHWHWYRASGKQAAAKGSTWLPGCGMVTPRRHVWCLVRGENSPRIHRACQGDPTYCTNPGHMDACGTVDGEAPPTDYATAHLAALPYPVRAVLEIASAAYGIHPALLLDRTRSEDVVEARQVVMAVLVGCGHRLADVGRYMARDHSTIDYGVKRAKSMHPDALARLRRECAHIMRGGPLDEGEARARIVSWCAGQERTTRRAVTAYVDQTILGSRRPCVEAPSGLYVLATRADVRGGLLAELALAGWDGHADRLWLHIQRSGWAAAS